mgnify:CR=1 FL=1
MSDQQNIRRLDSIKARSAYSDATQGAFLGAAIGDAIGYQVEFTGIKSRQDDRCVDGFNTSNQFSDDTQMAYAVARGLLAEGKLRPIPPSSWDDCLNSDLDRAMTLVAREFARWLESPLGGSHRAPGGKCTSSVSEFARDGGSHWSRAAGDRTNQGNGGGCGGVMRALPAALLYTGRVSEYAAIWQGRITHAAPLSDAACGAMGYMVGAIRNGNESWESNVILVARELDPEGDTADRIEDALARWESSPLRADGGGDPGAGVLDDYEGWAGHDAIAAALCIYKRFDRGLTDFRGAILEAANSPGDSDSIACLVGGLAGLKTGLKGLPVEWVEGLELIEELSDMGRSIADAAVNYKFGL